MVKNKQFLRIISDIKSLKIQGAQNIAKEAVKALSTLSETTLNKSKNTDIFLKELLIAKKQLFDTRSTEPCMRNALNFITRDESELKKKSVEDLVYDISIRSTEAIAQLIESEEKISKYGAEKIKDGMIIYTHCHSHSVINILTKAWNDGKHFEVHNTETRPRFQGRQTAIDLAKIGIPVTHYVDSAVRFALKKADIMLIGADAITTEGKVINKVGSELFAEAASRFSVPVYSCTTSWKFDPMTIFGFEEPIEKRFASEVWEKLPDGVRVNNFAFEQISPELISGVITELGIYKPELLSRIIKEKYPWMFNNK